MQYYAMSSKLEARHTFVYMPCLAVVKKNWGKVWDPKTWNYSKKIWACFDTNIFNKVFWLKLVQIA